MGVGTAVAEKNDGFGNGRFSDVAHKMPYFSSGLIALVAALMGVQAFMQLAAN